MPALLLAVHCKKSDPVSLKDAALEYVESTYGEKVRPLRGGPLHATLPRRPAALLTRRRRPGALPPQAAQDSADDLEAVEELRARVLADAGGGGSPAARAALCRYHRLLCAMESRFPVSRARGHVAVTFPWYDAFRASKRADQANIHFEKAAVVFNLGAALSQAALACDRAAGGGVDAARLFQEAAGAFGELRDSACLKVEPPRPVDLSPECAAMLERLMLAQAQECVADKAAADGKAPATLARLFKQVALYYDECSRLLAAPPLGDHFDRSWRAHAGVKSALAHLQADLHNAAALRAGDELKGVAQEIARLRVRRARARPAKAAALAGIVHVALAATTD
jgi:programmed cell death 6-interacting protein